MLPCLRAARLLFLLAAATWAVAGVVAQVHRVGVFHVYCAKHGVIEDRGDAPEQGRPQPDDRGHSDHQPCAFGLALHPAPLPDPGLTVSAIRMAVDGETMVSLPSVPPARRPLHSAPKTSPPVIANS